MSLLLRRQFLHQLGAAPLAASAASWVLAAPSAASAKPKIRVGQIGVAHSHAAGKIATMRKFADDYEVVGVVEPDEKLRRAAENSDAYRGLKWLTEEELLNTKGLQAVAVETDIRDLTPTAARCVAAGVHVHLDKPAGESLSAFKQVLDAATSKNLTIQMGYMFRYNPAFVFTFQAIRDGWLGNIFEAHGVISKTLGDDARRGLVEYRGGTMFELGCHLIDALVAALGKPGKVTPYTRRTQPEKDDLADNQLAVFEYPQATATIRSALMEVDGFRRRQFVVCGDAGTIEILPLEPPRLLLTLDRPRGEFRKGTQEVKLPKLGGRYDGDFLDLAQVIRGQKDFGFPPEHDLAVQEAILQASGLPVE